MCCWLANCKFVENGYIFIEECNMFKYDTYLFVLSFHSLIDKKWLLSWPNLVNYFVAPNKHTVPVGHIGQGKVVFHRF